MAGTLPVSETFGNPLFDSATVYYDFETLGSGGEVTDSGPNAVNLLAFDTTFTGVMPNLVPGYDGVGNGMYLPQGVVLSTTGTGSDDSILDTTRDTPFSIAAWIKKENPNDLFFIASKVLREVFDDGDGLELRGWQFTIESGGVLRAVWREDHTPTSGTLAQARLWVDSQTTILDTEWHHVALTYSYDPKDDFRGMRIYIDGQLQPMTATSTGLAGEEDVDLSAPDWPFNLNGRYDVQVNHGGNVDELAIWKSQLSAQDIASLAGYTPPMADFDLDGVIDGHDFLMWQRGETSPPLSADALAAWEAGFGTGSGLVAAVPEPTTAMTALVGLLLSAVAVGRRF